MSYKFSLLVNTLASHKSAKLDETDLFCKSQKERQVDFDINALIYIRHVLARASPAIFYPSLTNVSFTYTDIFSYCGFN